LVELTTMLKKRRWEKEDYLKEVAIKINKALQSIRDPGQYLSGRPVTLGNIRDVLKLHSRVENDSVKRLVGDTPVTNLQDIELKLAAGPGHDSPTEDDRISRATVPIQSLFKERPVENRTRGQLVQPKRIIIRGKPGIGKTTLSRRIMYEYCLNKNLRDQFKVVVRLSIAKLETRKSLAKLLFDEYFKADSRGNEMSTILEAVLLGEENP